MSDQKPVKIQNRAVVSLAPLWLIGWLFMIGYTHPGFWRAVLGILIWPYYLGLALR
jgi:hypothetical protein